MQVDAVEEGITVSGTAATVETVGGTLLNRDVHLDPAGATGCIFRSHMVSVRCGTGE
jgi:hypothetical protein